MKIPKYRYHRVHRNIEKVFIMVVFAKNALFKSYGIISLPQMPPTTLTPQKSRWMPKESTEGWKDIEVRDFN